MIPAEGDGGSGARSRRPAWLLVAGVAAAAVIALVVAVLVAGGDDDGGYDDGSRDRFLAACTADGGEPVAPTCQCIYDQLVATVPYDRFARLDEQLAADRRATPDRTEVTLPDDLQALVERCRAETTSTAS